jgi:hypothetical protein
VIAFVNPPQIQLKFIAEEMQAINKGLEKVEQELAASVNDGAISLGFRKVRIPFVYFSQLLDVGHICSVYD